jgi:hypothetical protein
MTDRYKIQDDSEPMYPGLCYSVIDILQDGTELGSGRYLSFSEANIIIFALNTIANGGSLWAHMPNPKLEGYFAGYFEKSYDGPTDEVAPITGVSVGAPTTVDPLEGITPTQSGESHD